MKIIWALQKNWPEYILKTIIFVIVFCIGATLFSYLNVVVKRLPRGENLTTGRSKCPNCGHAFEIKDSIPIYSWFRYKGKCIYCFEKMPVRNTWIEILGGVFAVLVTACYQVSFAALISLLVCAVLTVIALLDVDDEEILPIFYWLLLVFGVAAIFLMPQVTVLQRVIGIFPIAMILMAFYGIRFREIQRSEIPLMAVTGFLLGWKASVVAFVIGLLFFGIYRFICRKKQPLYPVTFIAFLCIGVAISMYGQLGTFLMDLCLRGMTVLFHR